MKARLLLVGVAGLLMSACATIPTGPSVMVLPGTGKSFEQFQVDDGACRQWALQQTGTTAEHATNKSAVSGAAIGTVVGAAAGAAIGAAAGNPALGAAVGAGTGLFGGSAIGYGEAYGSGYRVQRRYDIAYMQCMYANGNQIPVARGSQPAYTQPTAAVAPARPPDVPPPPPGPPPPPPK